MAIVRVSNVSPVAADDQAQSGLAASAAIADAGKLTQYLVRPESEYRVRPKVAAASTTAGSGAQKVATSPAPPYVIFSLVLLVGGFIGGVLLQAHFHPGMKHLPAIPAGIGTFALLYVVAQAIERLLVPVSWFGGGFLGLRNSAVNGLATKSQLAQNNQGAMVQALNEPDDGNMQAAADTQHDLDQYKANLTATTFGVAALLAMLACGYTGLFLLAAAKLHVAGWLDLLVTGLAIAGGTKPLHDTISYLSSTKKGQASDISL